MAFPTSVDSFTGYTASETLLAANNAAQLNQMQTATVAIEDKIGTGASTPINNTFLAGNGTGTSTWRGLTTSDIGFSPLSILQQVYPIGCIYTETTGVNPSVTFGFGTWVQTAQGRMLVGNGTSDAVYAAGNQGGSSTTTLSVNQMPSHSHSINDPGHVHTQTFTSASGAIASGAVVGNNTGSNTGSSTTGITNNNTGGGQAFSNLSPYLVVYYWERTA